MVYLSKVVLTFLSIQSRLYPSVELVTERTSMRTPESRGKGLYTDSMKQASRSSQTSAARQAWVFNATLRLPFVATC